MNFKVIRAKVIDCLLKGQYIHENRIDQAEKNLFAIGIISEAEVIKILKGCNGNEYTCSELHSDLKIPVHLFKSQKWYIKLYFVDPDCFFISVHQ